MKQDSDQYIFVLSPSSPPFCIFLEGSKVLQFAGIDDDLNNMIVAAVSSEFNLPTFGDSTYCTHCFLTNKKKVLEISKKSEFQLLPTNNGRV